MWLLYGGCIIAVFTIAIALIVTMCLRKGENHTYDSIIYPLSSPALTPLIQYSSCTKTVKHAAENFHLVFHHVLTVAQLTTVSKYLWTEI